MNTGGRIVIAGTQSGAGKTTLTLGLMGALKKRGYTIKPFKVGPDYIDPQFHCKVTGIPSRNLDTHLLQERVVQALFTRQVQAGDLAIIEGVMGLYDGVGTQGHQGSTAHVAKTLGAPVILVINGSGLSNSAAAMVKGYQDFDPDVKVKGVIINHVSGEKHYLLLKKIIEGSTGAKCLGYLNKNMKIELKSRHLGLVPTEEALALDEKLAQMTSMVEETVDLDGVLQLAREAEALESLEAPRLDKTYTGLKIAYALDKAFHFYYEDNLDLLREAGVELIPFSPLLDSALPTGIHGIYLGGGFPEVFASELSRNGAIRRAIKEKAQGGIPIFGECGGLMYLTEAIIDFHGNRYEMVGVFDGAARMTSRLQHFGYNEIQCKENRLFNTNGIGSIRGHEFHRAVVEGWTGDYCYHAKKIRDHEVVDQWQCGYEKYSCLAGFSHFHFYSNLKFPKAYLEACQRYYNRREDEENVPSCEKNRV